MSPPRLPPRSSSFDEIKNRLTKAISDSPVGDIARKLDEKIRFTTIKDSLNSEYTITDVVIEKLEGGGELLKGKNNKINKDILVKKYSINALINYFTATYHFKKNEAEKYIEKQLSIQEEIIKLNGRHVATVKEGDSYYIVLKDHLKCEYGHQFSRLNVIQKIDIAINMVNRIKQLHDNRILYLGVLRKSFYVGKNLEVTLNENSFYAEYMQEGFSHPSLWLRGHHLPPELRFVKEGEVITYSTKTDVYALGMVLLELFYDVYDDNHVDLTSSERKEKIKLYEDYCFLKYTFLSEDKSAIAPLICAMIMPDLEKRISIPEVCKRLTALQESQNNFLKAEATKKPEEISLKPTTPTPFAPTPNYSFGLFTHAAIGATAAVTAEYVRRWCFS